MSRFTRLRSLLPTVLPLFTFLTTFALSQSLPVVHSRWRDHTSAQQSDTETEQTVGRSNVILERPNLLSTQALPLGNGSLGASVWAAEGTTIQLNRADTLPRRLSAGHVVIPALGQLTGAPDFHGQLDLYNGELVESGGGMTCRIFVQPSSDLLIVAVTGADASRQLTAELRLWTPRQPKAATAGSVGTFEESWIDDYGPGASGRTFGSLAGLTAEARHITLDQPSPVTLRIRFQPHPDGSFRLLIPVPHWVGTGSPLSAVRAVLAFAAPNDHRRWWHDYWQHTGLIRIHSVDGTGEYIEALRTLYLFYAAADRGTFIPGTQAGIADMLSSDGDMHNWDPAAFWHWNLRMETAANLSAGHPELNLPYFQLYRDNLASMQAWTRTHMSGRPGICIPETMRFNGYGIEYERWNGKEVTGLNCDAHSPPFYNARTVSTGAEVASWIWQQYLATDDSPFLAQNYPLLREASLFLISYETTGSDQFRHTSPSNAHETQWDTLDPTIDLVARRVLYSNTLDAARLLGIQPRLRDQLTRELTLIPSLPRTSFDGKTLRTSAETDESDDIIAESYLPAVQQHNVENIGLEPVWPWSQIGDNSPSTTLAQRTWEQRPFHMAEDWSFDPIQAARLGLGDEVKSTLIDLTKHYQVYPNGLASWGGGSHEFYIEQSAVAAVALSEALVQDYDGVLRIAPAIPHDWDFDGTVYVQHRLRVAVRTAAQTVRDVTIQAIVDETLSVRNPWPNQDFVLHDLNSGVTTRVAGHSVVSQIALRANHSYRLQPLPPTAVAATSKIQESSHSKDDADDAKHNRPAVKHLGDRSIGLSSAQSTP